MATIETLGDVVNERGVSSGHTAIRAVRATLGEDSDGRPAIFIDVTLSNPPAGEDTWPVEEIWEIRRTISSIVMEAAPELELPWYISFVPEDAGDLEPGDTHDEVDIP